jgi:hypothetical protein
MAELAPLAERHGLWLLEDAAQAIGARATGVAAGGFGARRGAQLLPDEEPRRARRQGHGPHARRRARGPHPPGAPPGADGELRPRLARLLLAPRCAAGGGARRELRHLDGWNAGRRTVASRYATLLAEAGLTGRPDAPVVAPSPAGDARLPPVRDPGTRARPAARPPRRRGHRHHGLLPHAAPPAAGARRARTPGGAFPQAERAAGRCSRCRSTPS